MINPCAVPTATARGSFFSEELACAREETDFRTLAVRPEVEVDKCVVGRNSRHRPVGAQDGYLRNILVGFTFRPRVNSGNHDSQFIEIGNRVPERAGEVIEIRFCGRLAVIAVHCNRASHHPCQRPLCVIFRQQFLQSTEEVTRFVAGAICVDRTVNGRVTSVEDRLHLDA